MTWAELKLAAEQAGIAESDDILAIECELHDGNKTLKKVHLGQFVKLIEGIAAHHLKEEWCAD